MLPPLDPETGHLPMGRHVGTLAEVEADFVGANRFAASTTRSSIWEGFERWLGTWASVEDQLGPGLLQRLWIGGSFTSAELNPGDIDVTPFVDATAVERSRGKPGIGTLRALVQQRDRVTRVYHVEPFVVWWRPVAAILRHDELSPDEREYLAWRGACDDLWQRVRPPGPKGPPLAGDAPARRGYVEVIL